MTTNETTTDVSEEVTPQVLIERAKAMRPMLRAQQAEAEALGHYGPETHQAFVDAGFYDLLTPRRFGGLEFGLPTFAEVISEIGRGDPSAAWCLGLGIGHTLTLASYWPEQAQREIFGNPLGYFRSNHRFVPMGTARPVAGGYVVNGTWDYCSGIQYASHFKATARVEDDGEPRQVVVVIPAGQFTVLDDWGGDRILGMRASGSNSVRIDDVFVPEHWVVSMDWRPGDRSDTDGPAPGVAIHGNPMYNGRIRLHYMLELTAPIVGAALAALDEFETILLTKKTTGMPKVLRAEDPNSQRDFGLVAGLADSARGLMLWASQQYMDYSQEWADGGEPFTIEKDMRLRAVMMQGGFTACEAVEKAFYTASSSSAKKGQLMERYFRDVAMYRGHNGTQYLNSAPALAKAHFGLLQTTSAIS